MELPNKEYWTKRQEQNIIAQEKKAEEYNSKLLNAYKSVKENINNELAVFYQRYAINNNISYADAQKLLSKSEITKFKDSLEEYISMAKEKNATPEHIKKLENMSIRARVKRIESLQISIEQEIELLISTSNSNIGNLLSNNYSDSYYRSLWTIQTGLQFGLPISLLNKTAIEKVVKTAWLDENYSDRIYKNKDKLIRTLEIEMLQSFIRGDSGQNTAKRIYKRLDISYNEAKRLVRTESNHISNEAIAEGYIKSGVVSKYEYLATLDLLTSKICRFLDNQIVKLSDKRVGVNFPPLHSNCRSTTIPHFEDEVAIERIARDSKGKSYYVDGNMSYNDWFNKYVK